MAREGGKRIAIYDITYIYIRAACAQKGGAGH